MTTDGGKSWAKKHVAKDQDPSSPPLNNDLEGIGFIDELHGWVGGWGFQDLSTPVGGLENSYTEDGGDTWIAQNHLPNPDTKIPNDPRYRINRYRFVKDINGAVTSGYCSGQQVFKLNISHGKKKGAFAARTFGLSAPAKRLEPANSTQTPAYGGRSTSALLTSLGAAGATQVGAIEPDHGFKVTEIVAVQRWHGPDQLHVARRF